MAASPTKDGLGYTPIHRDGKRLSQLRQDDIQLTSSLNRTPIPSLRYMHTPRSIVIGVGWHALRYSLKFYDIFHVRGAVEQVSGRRSVDGKDYLSVLRICYIWSGGKVCNRLQSVRAT